MQAEDVDLPMRAALEAVTGKPVWNQPDADVPAYAVLKLAQSAETAHILRYRPDFEAELAYLSAFQCGMALRTLQADPQHRFDLVPTPQMLVAVQRLVAQHVQQQQSNLSESLFPELARQMGHGLGLQLRSMPIAIRVDRGLWQDYPALRGLQRQNIQRQLQEAMHALSPAVQAFAPPMIVAANASMSCAFAKFWGETWDQPEVAVPFISAGYGKLGDELLELVRSIDPTPNGDRTVVDQWAQRLGLADWFTTIDKT